MRARKKLGLLGCGAFGSIAAKWLSDHFDVLVYDPAVVTANRPGLDVDLTWDIARVASADIVVLATPISGIRAACRLISPHLSVGATVLDVASVKISPCRIMEEELPSHVDIVGTHPLFGPQSVKNGIAGLDIVVCPVRSGNSEAVVDFLQDRLGLNVIMTTPDEHDRQIAFVQGLTHLISRVLINMEPFPTNIRTRSFDFLLSAVELVRHDSNELFMSIERDNPYVEAVLRNFFSHAENLRSRLTAREMNSRFMDDTRPPMVYLGA
jgi:prephenate dehydrogenase